jgi:hypothetical protein
VCGKPYQEKSKGAMIESSVQTNEREVWKIVGHFFALSLSLALARRKFAGLNNIQNFKDSLDSRK